MSDFVQIRFQTSKSSRGTINHDFRLSKVSYLRDDQHHNAWDNNYFNFEPKVVANKMKKSLDDYKSKYKARNNREFRSDRNSDLLQGIITLSPSINQKLKNGEISKKQLDEKFKKAIQASIKQMRKLEPELELFYATVHYDEKTPHVHFATSNHLQNGTSFFQSLKKSGLSIFQDIVGAEFEDIGFRRGIKKEITGAKHKSVREMHAEEIKQLKLEIKEIQAHKKELKKELEDREQLKIELNSLDLELKSKREVIKQLKSFDADIVLDMLTNTDTDSTTLSI